MISFLTAGSIVARNDVKVLDSDSYSRRRQTFSPDSVRGTPFPSMGQQDASSAIQCLVPPQERQALRRRRSTRLLRTKGIWRLRREWSSALLVGISEIGTSATPPRTESWPWCFGMCIPRTVLDRLGRFWKSGAMQLRPVSEFVKCKSYRLHAQRQRSAIRVQVPLDSRHLHEATVRDRQASFSAVRRCGDCRIAAFVTSCLQSGSEGLKSR